MKRIASVHNEQIKRLAKLVSSAKERRSSRQTVLEGVHLLDACLKSDRMPRQVYIPEHRLDKPEIQALLARINESRAVVVDGAVLAKITSLSAGEDVMALLDLPEETVLPGNGDCVVLEGVQDPGNVGTILRSAAAAGVRQIVLDPNCAEVWSPKVLRSAMGAHFLLELHPRADLVLWRSLYADPVWATALGGKNHGLYSLDLSKPCAWVFGNEGCGVSELMQQAADGTVRIPMAGGTESLNVAMAATVCLFEQLRQRI